LIDGSHKEDQVIYIQADPLHILSHAKLCKKALAVKPANTVVDDLHYQHKKTSVTKDLPGANP
jgi:hypothetical protein